MNIQDLLDKISVLELDPAGEPLVPPPEVVAFFVRWVRGLRQWKKSTLADFADVSISTVERVERGEKVNDETLNRIAIALGYETGYFTTPRRAIAREEANAQLQDSFGHLEPVRVFPMRSHRSIREAAGCHAFLIHDPGVPESLRPDILNLGEWLDLASFILSKELEQEIEGRGRRALYNDILECVRSLEKQGYTVLSGVTAAPQEGIPDWKVAVISVTSKATDPAAIKRQYLFVDRRCIALRADSKQAA